MARLNSLGEAAPDVATNPTLPLAPDQPLALTDTLDVPIGYAYELHVNLEGGSEAPSLPPEELWLSPEAQPVEMDGLRLLHRDRSRNDQLVPITAEDLEDAEAFFTARYTLIAQFSVGADDGLAERLVCDRLSLHCLECLQNYLHEAQQRFGLTTQQTVAS